MGAVNTMEIRHNQSDLLTAKDSHQLAVGIRGQTGLPGCLALVKLGGLRRRAKF